MLQTVQSALDGGRRDFDALEKAALQALPQNDQLLNHLQSAGLLEDADPHTRLAAILRLTEVPESPELGALLYRMSLTPEVAQDRWLSDAVYVAAAQHRPGFMQAYASAVGDAQYRAQAEQIAARIQAGPQQGEQQPSWPPREERSETIRPVAERLLEAYVEDVVGPIERPDPASRFGNRGGAREDVPVFELTMSVIPGQLKFALPEFTVKPGQRVRITLTNPDDMDALVDPADVGALDVWIGHLPHPDTVADTTRREARLPKELATITPYDRCWEWADAFDADGRVTDRRAGRPGPAVATRTSKPMPSSPCDHPVPSISTPSSLSWTKRCNPSKTRLPSSELNNSVRGTTKICSSNLLIMDTVLWKRNYFALK